MAFCGEALPHHGRDRKYCEGFQRLLEESGTNVLRLPPRSPNLNAYSERFVLSIKQECLDRMIFFSEKSLRRAVAAYMAHYTGSGIIKAWTIA